MELIEVKSDLPDLLRLEGTLCAYSLPAFQTGRLAAVGCVSRISMIVLQWPDWPIEERLPMWRDGACGEQTQTCAHQAANGRL
jgi:hypothetical protein